MEIRRSIFMIKTNRIQAFVLFGFTILFGLTSVTAQAATLQEVIEVSNMKGFADDPMMAAPIDKTENQGTEETITECVVTEAKATMEEARVQKELEAQRLAEEQRIAQEKLLAEYDLELLASIIFCEAGNQSYEGQVAVGAVVMNRVKSERFPNTMEEVIYQSGQFTPAMTGWLDRIRASSGYTDSAMQAAKDAVLGVDPVNGCLFFDQGGYGYRIGAHYFHD